MTPETSSLLRSAPPPLWFVTNGDVTVGPVSTNLLLRGVAADRVPDDCLVRERKWRSWRVLDGVREVAALRRDIARVGAVDVPVAAYGDPGARADAPLERLRGRLARVQDPTDAMNLCMLEAVRQTGALVGAVHRRYFPQRALITVGATGPGMSSRVGRFVYKDDPVLALASEGHSLFGEPNDLASTVLQDCLGGLPACSGVAMVPVQVSGRLYAMLELGRPDHAFREEDIRRVARIADVAANRFGMVCNPDQVPTDRAERRSSR